ncbi:MAG: hypothetical protein ABI591_01720 [Kofleriaceae bacterium]
MALPSHARAWLHQRETGAVAVAVLEDAALRQLDTTAALQQSEALLSAMPMNAFVELRRATSGFVDQQRLFARYRR